VNLPVLFFTALVSVLAGVLFGLVPAWQISPNDLNSSLQQTSRTARQRKLMTKVMIVAEFALSLILLAAAGLLGKSLLVSFLVGLFHSLQHAGLTRRSSINDFPVNMGTGTALASTVPLYRLAFENPQLRIP
jgi:hypothetical protein